MCGVIGVIDLKKSVSKELYYGLLALQHRGQDNCGIVTISNSDVYTLKKKGLVLDVFTENNLKGLKGNIGIGQTRYSTIGALSNNNSQPLLLNTKNKIVMAHNGNITNYVDLKEQLYKKHIFMQTNIDIEPVLNVFSICYQETKDVFKAAKQVINKIKGGYSIVGAISEKGLFVIRDPHGIRPLVMGKKKDGYIFASESIVLQSLGYEYVRDVLPGEAIFIDYKTLNLKSKIIKPKKKHHCMFEWVYFARPESIIEKRTVYKSRLALGAILAKKLKSEKIDVVIPVPDTARTTATKISDVLGVRNREGLIKNRYVGRTFIKPSKKERDESVNIKLNPVICVVKNKNVAVIDDSIVRGTTSKHIVKLLKKAGAKKIIFVSSCPPIKYPCFYGIDMSTNKELIANKKTVEEIRKYIGADKLYYTDIVDLKKAIRVDLCTACLDCKYPVKINKNQLDFFNKDKKER